MITSFDYKNKIYRTLNKISLQDNIKSTYDYQKNDKYYPFANIHWGRVKLFYSELELFTLISQYTSLAECVCVYVGSAPGSHLLILLELFPDLTYILYDPRDVDKRLQDNKRVIIRTGKYFSDETIDEVLKYAKDKKIIFISDIRRTADDHEVMKDMVDQQRWAIKLNSDFIQLKFRFPFFNKHQIEFLRYNDENDYQKKYHVTNIPKDITNCMFYLNGTIYLQVFSKFKSAETRLFVAKNKYVNKTEKSDYSFTYYDIFEYETKLSYHNLILRPLFYKYKKSKIVHNFIISFYDTYDFVGTYQITYNYLKNVKKITDKTTLNQQTITLLHTHYTYFMNLYEKNFYSILLKKNIKEFMKQPKLFTFENIRNIVTTLINVEKYYKKQTKLVNNNAPELYLNEFKNIKLANNEWFKFENNELVYSDNYINLILSLKIIRT